jgi:uncharacterized protein (DUF1501 family)
MAPFTRRSLLHGAVAAAGLASIGAPAQAATVAPAERRFLFVQALGGWDPACFFAPNFGSSILSMEAEAVAGTEAGIPFVDHPSRPSVRTFLRRWGAQTAVLNGLYVQSISHSSATRLIHTGVVDGATADWATRIAVAQAAERTIPYLIVAGAAFSGAYGVHVGRAGANGQLAGLTAGTLLEQSERPVTLPVAAHTAAVDAYLRDVASRGLGGAALHPAARRSYEIALERSIGLKALASNVDLSFDSSFGSQVHLALTALSEGISRCTSVMLPRSNDNNAWDSHTSNNALQSPLYETLFRELDRLMTELSTWPGTQGGTLLDETVVVVLSEMGRTPFLNGTGGKDHWPYTSAMVIGAGVAGGQAVGAYDDNLQGLAIDLQSGELDPDGVVPGCDVFGATLLALGGLDPVAEGLVVDPITAVLA